MIYDILSSKLCLLYGEKGFIVSWFCWSNRLLGVCSVDKNSKCCDAKKYFEYLPLSLCGQSQVPECDVKHPLGMNTNWIPAPSPGILNLSSSKS